MMATSFGRFVGSTLLKPKSSFAQFQGAKYSTTTAEWSRGKKIESLIIDAPQLAQTRFASLLEVLHESNTIDDGTAESAKKEFASLCDYPNAVLKELFKDYDHSSDKVGLDSVYSSFMLENVKFQHLWKIIKISLILSHGNAVVESLFSVNKALLAENMQEETIVAQRVVHDAINEAGGIEAVHISKKMLDYVRGARQRYTLYLEHKKLEQTEKEKKNTEKRKLEEQLKKLESEKKSEKKKLKLEVEQKQAIIDKELMELQKKKSCL